MFITHARVFKLSIVVYSISIGSKRAWVYKTGVHPIGIECVSAISGIRFYGIYRENIKPPARIRKMRITSCYR